MVTLGCRPQNQKLAVSSTHVFIIDSGSEKDKEVEVKRARRSCLEFLRLIELCSFSTRLNCPDITYKLLFFHSRLVGG